MVIEQVPNQANDADERVTFSVAAPPVRTYHLDHSPTLCTAHIAAQRLGLTRQPSDPVIDAAIREHARHVAWTSFFAGATIAGLLWFALWCFMGMPS